MTVGERIRKTRIEAKMTQKQLGELCGMADSAIRKYESGRVTPKFKTLERIAQALDVDPYYLQEGKAIRFERLDIAKAVEMAAKEFDLQLFAEDEQLSRLNANYDALNDHSRTRLVEYSDDLVSNPQNRRNPDKQEQD